MMPERLESHVYSPETAKLMKAAFDEAWMKVALIEDNAKLTRQLLASAIIDQINVGALERNEIVAAAIATLAVARNSPR
jgi:hypothetical protein